MDYIKTTDAACIRFFSIFLCVIFRVCHDAVHVHLLLSYHLSKRTAILYKFPQSVINDVGHLRKDPIKAKGKTYLCSIFKGSQEKLRQNR